MTKPGGLRSLGISLGVAVLLGLLVDTTSSAVSSVTLMSTGNGSDLSDCKVLTVKFFKYSDKHCRKVNSFRKFAENFS
jgi:hypothetical protein